ncbi:MAG: biotin--[acetyl-CoA-carboxylase] ligase [Acidobacteria bacterium]|nr:biotin--[acetyl-CoA-carboxylase] ligase [Acidobacteriota bacterium]
MDSTHRLARRIVDEYSSDDLVVPDAWVVALEQTAGRGRGAHRWESASGAGVYLTRILPLAEARSLRNLPLLVAASAAETLDGHLRSPCRLKWPNDLMVGEAKIGGVLIEALSRPGGRAVALLGVGINHRRPREVGEARPVTSVGDESASPPDLAELTRELMLSLERDLADLEDDAGVLERYTRRSIHRPGDQLTCRVGGRLLEGSFLGFDTAGRLRLQTGEGRESLSAGEIVELDPRRPS